MEKCKYCEACGAKIVEYKHSFSHALAVGLFRIYQHRGHSINIKELELTRNQWDNFQKLRYWNLVSKAYRDDGTRISGAWSITHHGIDFVEGRISIKQNVWTYRGQTMRFDGEDCLFSNAHSPKYKKRLDYSSEAVAH